MEQLQQTISSLEVSEMMEKNHKNLIRSIETFIKHFTELKIEPSDYFIESSYKDTSGKTNKCYKVTKLGCELIAHKLTGIKGTAFTVKFINRFHDMEETIKQAAIDQKEQQEQTKVPWTTTTTLVPLMSEWSSRNLPKVKEIARSISPKTSLSFVMCKLYDHLGMVYNLTVAKEIYRKETGKSATMQDLELIEYFSQLQEEAEKILDEMLAEKSIKKYKWN